VTSKEVSDVYGLVLTGGKSLRMGKDKSFINYHGKPQQEHLYNVLKTFLPKVYISHRSGQKIVSGLDNIEDQFKIESPLNGILSAFQHNPKVAWLVVACDMPLIGTKEVSLILKERKPKKLATCFLGTDQKPHPLFTIYEPNAYQSLKKHASKSISPRAFLMANDINIVTATSNDFLRNANSPEEYDELKKLIKKD